MIFNTAMKEYEEGDQINMSLLETLKTPHENYDHFYDFGKMNHRGFQHMTYEASPYEGTIGFYSYTSTNRNHKKAKKDSSENSYEALVLKKITKLTSDDGKITKKEFVINIPVSMIPIMTIVFKKILQYIDGADVDYESMYSKDQS